MSNASLRSERRRSLPLPTSPTAPRMSVLSVGSIGSMNSFGSATDDLSLGLTSPGFASSGLHSPTASVHTFQQRRRRAAKLTQFFGVNYRELIRDVLESIENGLERERRRGTMQEEEVEVSGFLVLDPVNNTTTWDRYALYTGDGAPGTHLVSRALGSSFSVGLCSSSVCHGHFSYFLSSATCT